MVFGARFELATMRPSTARVYQIAPPEHWWAVKDSNLGDSNGIPGLQPGAFGLSANCPSELSKIWRKAGGSNAYVPRDLVLLMGLADQWDTNYPSLPGASLRLN